MPSFNDSVCEIIVGDCRSVSIDPALEVSVFRGVDALVVDEDSLMVTDDAFFNDVDDTIAVSLGVVGATAVVPVGAAVSTVRSCSTIICHWLLISRGPSSTAELRRFRREVELLRQFLLQLPAVSVTEQT